MVLDGEGGQVVATPAGFEKTVARMRAKRREEEQLEVRTDR
jgi:hypothetical protein